MSDSLNRTLEQIGNKSAQLIEYCDALREQNELLNVENQSLTKALQLSLEKAGKFEQRINVLQMARSVTDSDEKSLDIKQKINEFVQEIDKCITLLNK